jgi:predicted nuclease of predicted toxin-antitoxin system
VRILADENIPGHTVNALIAAGHDVSWIAKDAPSTSDEIILGLGQENERVVLTFDKDFGELVYRDRLPANSGVILLRLSTQAPREVTRIVLLALNTRPSWNGVFAVVLDEAVRVSELPT